MAVRSVWEVAADLIDPPVHPYLRDPVGWATDRLGEFLWSKQREIAASTRDHRYTAVQSCHDVGKSFLSARLAVWWIDVHPPGEAFVVTTAPTDPQVKAILWREIGRAHRRATERGEPLPGRVTQDAQWKLPLGGPDELVAYGRKPSDYEPTAFQGIHARYVLIIIDEACGVPRALFDAVDSLATNEDARVLAIGNPDDPASHFATVCKPGSGWNTLRISAFDSPNFTDEPVPETLQPLLISRTWVEERRKRWTEKSPLWQSKVLGLFPAVSTQGLVEPGWVLAAQHRTLERGHPRTLGVDVARYGPDRTVVYLREGPVFRKRAEAAKGATTETAGLVRVIIAEESPAGPLESRIDEVGVGAGVYDQLWEAGERVVGLNGGSAPYDRERFVNARAEWYWGLRQRFEDADVDLDPDDDDLASQLQQIRWRLNSRGQIVIESKDEMQKRGLPSPDHADAAMMASANTGWEGPPPAREPQDRWGRDREPSGFTDGVLQQQW